MQNHLVFEKSSDVQGKAAICIEGEIGSGKSLTGS